MSTTQSRLFIRPPSRVRLVNSAQLVGTSHERGIDGEGREVPAHRGCGYAGTTMERKVKSRQKCSTRCPLFTYMNNSADWKAGSEPGQRISSPALTSNDC